MASYTPIGANRSRWFNMDQETVKRGSTRNESRAGKRELYSFERVFGLL